MALDNWYSESEFATAVYKKGYIKELIHNHESVLAHLNFKTESEALLRVG